MKSLPVLVLFGASLLWGLTWLPLKSLNAMGFDGVSLILAGFALLSLVLTPALYRQRRWWLSDKRKLLWIGLLGGAANLAFAYALIYGQVVRVMVLFYLLPVWGVLGGRLILREHVDGWRWLGVVLAVGGAFIVLGGFRLLDTPPSWIDLVALLSGFFYAMTNLAFRAVQSIPVTSKTAAMFYGCFFLAAVTLWLTAEPFTGGDSALSWVALAAYALFWLLAANFGSQWGVTHMETGRSSIIMITELVTAVVSAALIRGETLSTAESVGGVLILTAAFIEARRDMTEYGSGTEMKR